MATKWGYQPPLKWGKPPATNPSAGTGGGSVTSGASSFGGTPTPSWDAYLKRNPASGPTDSPGSGLQGQTWGGMNHDSGTTVPGELSGPGVGEKFWSDNQDAFNKPGGLSEFINGASGRLFGNRFAPTNSYEAYGHASNIFKTPGKGTTNAYDISGQLKNPTQGEGYIKDAAGYFQGPNLAHNYATDTADFFKTPGRTSRYADDNAEYLRNQGAGESYAYRAAQGPELRAPGAAETNLAHADASLDKIRYGDSAVDYATRAAQSAGRTSDYAAGLAPFVKESPVSDEFNFFRPQLREKSYSEQLYESGKGESGLTTYYDRENEKRQKAITDRMAAMGVFGSGATARAMAETEADIGAAQARDMAGLAAQGDASRIARTGAAESFVTNAGQEQLARRQLGLDAAAGADEIDISKAGALTDAYGLASQEGLGRVNARTTAANAAEQAMLERIFGTGEMVQAADRLGLERIGLGGDLANAADTQDLNRVLGGSTVAATGDESLFTQGQGLAGIGESLANTEINRLDTSATTGLAADAEETARAKALMESANSIDDLEAEAGRQGIAIETLLGNLQASVDAEDWKRFMDRFHGSLDVQTAGENRLNNQLDNTFKVDSTKAGIVERGTNTATGERGAYEEDAINMLMAQAGMNRQEAEQEYEEMLAMGMTAVQISQMLGKGGGVGSTGSTQTGGLPAYQSPSGGRR